MGISALRGPDVWLDQRQLHPPAAAHRQRRRQPLPDASATSTHDFKFGVGWRRTDIYSQTIYPGNGVVAYENSATDFRAPRLSRGRRHQPRRVHQLLRRRHASRWAALTLDLGVRYDRSGARRCRARTQPNAAFPNLVPGHRLRRLRSAVHVEQHLAARRHDLRARRGPQDASCAPASAATPDS